MEFGAGISPPEGKPAPAAPASRLWLDRAFIASVFLLGCFALAAAFVISDLRKALPAVVATPSNGAAVTVPVPAPPPAPPPSVAQPLLEPPKPAIPAELPPLPETVLGKVPVHTIPDPGGPDRNVSPEVANGPSTLKAPVTAPKQFSGAAQVSGPDALLVGTVPVQLYGIMAPATGDRCGMAGNETCATLAERTLATQLAAGKISCQVPSPKPGIVVAFAICLDSQGTDIGGSLVSDGLALADPRQSYDYVGAESIAKGQKRGLWAFRTAPAH